MHCSMSRIILLCFVSCLLWYAEAVPADLTINAIVLRNDNSSGNILVASGFPLIPGALLPEDLAYVRVFVEGVEQACAVGATRGRHPDGSLRSVIIEFNYNIPDNNTIPAYVQLGSIKRQVLDIDFVRITFKMVGKALITPSEPEYLCRTNAVLAPLVPATADSAEVTAWHELLTSSWKKSLRTTYSGTALYDFGSGLLAWYMRTGELLALKDAAYFSTWNLAYYTPYANDTCCTQSQRELNPEGIEGQGFCSACGLSAEWWSLRYVMNFAFYHFFGYEQYLYYMWHQGQGYMSTLGNRPTATNCMSTNYGYRFNFGLFFFPVVMGYLTEGTKNISGGFGNGPGDPNYPVKLPLIVDCLDYSKFSDPADTRFGMVGILPTATGDFGASYPGVCPNFQISVAADWLILYYQNIHADPRIPEMVRVLGDFIIAEISPSIEGDVGYPESWVMPYVSYRGTYPAGPRPYHGYLVPMFTNTFGFLYAYYKNETYKTWGDRTIVPKNMHGMGWITKVWGEVYHGLRHSYSYYINGGAAEGLDSTRPRDEIPPVTNTTDPIMGTKVTAIEVPPVAGIEPTVAPQSTVSAGSAHAWSILTIGATIGYALYRRSIND